MSLFSDLNVGADVPKQWGMMRDFAQIVSVHVMDLLVL